MKIVEGTSVVVVVDQGALLKFIRTGIKVLWPCSGNFKSCQKYPSCSTLSLIDISCAVGKYTYKTT